MKLSNHRIVALRYLFPRRAPVADPWVVQVEGAELHCIKHSAGEGTPWVVHFHGNGEVVSDWAGDFVHTLVRNGVSVVLAEYREYGGSTGKALLGELCDDGLAVIDALGVPAEQVVVYGRSIGSIPALHIAAHRPVKALVVESGIADVHQRIAIRVDPAELGVTADRLHTELSTEFDHEAKMQQTNCPVLVMHTELDHMVDPVHAEQLADWAGDRARLVLFDIGDHNSIFTYNGAEILRHVCTMAGM